MADRLERDFLRPALAAIPHNTRNKLTTGQVAAIASFSYNTGVQGFKDSSFGSNLIKGDIEGAAEVLPNSYVNPGTKVEAGLRNRRKDELKMFNGTK
jgi:GH24 family phage-related lysozyme (muramidase)